MDKYDVIIVGAGPTGMAAAIALSKDKNIKSLLLEKNSFCNPVGKSWATFESTLKKYNLMNSKVFKLKNIVMKSLRGKKLILDVKKDPVWVMNEEKVLKTLLKRVKIQKKDYTYVKKIIRKHNRITLETNKGSFRTKLLIDASGAGSLARKYFGLSMDTMCWMYCQMRENCDFTSHDIPWGYMMKKKKASDPFFGTWAEPYSRTKVLVATSRYSHKRVPIKRHLEFINLFLKDKDYSKAWKNSKVVKSWRVGVPMTPLEEFIFDNVIIVGDSAGHVRPLTVEGFRPGMELGAFAGNVASKAVKNKNYSKRFLSQFTDLIYEKEISFFENQEISKILQIFLFYLTDTEYDRFFDNLNKLDNNLKMNFLKSQLRAKDMTKVFSFIAKTVNLPTFLLRLNDKDRHTIIKNVELYAEDLIIYKLKNFFHKI